MRLLAPAWLAAGVAVALALVALHLLAVGRPAPMAWPTARFVPARAARARRLARRPADPLLLAVRVAAALLAALALARPVRTPARRAVARVVVADRSAAARDAGAVRDSVRALAGAGDLLVAFDTAAAAPVTLGATAAARDSAITAALAPRAAGDTTAMPAAGSLSAALAAARRAAPALRETADSVELVIVSPLTARELDAATPALRAAWGGRARVSLAAPAPEATAPDGVRVVARRGGPADDALAAAAGLVGTRGSGPGARVGTGGSGLGARGGVRDTGLGTRGGPDPRVPSPASRPARIVRDGPTPADLAWARDSGGVLLDWPASAAPAGWARRARVDTAGAVVAGGAAFVASLPRRAAWPGGGTVVARWADGEPAAAERAAGAGCVRAVAVPVPQAGDAALRAPFLAFLAAMAAPCAHRSPGAPPDSATVRALAGAGPLLAASSLASAEAARDPLGAWLLGAAAALLLAELPLRRVGRRAAPDAAGDSADAAPGRTAGAAPEAAA